MKSTKLYSNYCLEEGNCYIFVKTDENNDKITSISLKTNEENEEFKFLNSNPEVLITIGKLITKAGEMALEKNSRFKSTDRT